MGIEKLIQHIVVKSAVNAAMKSMDKEGEKSGLVTSEGSLVLRLNIVVKVLVYGYFMFNIFVAIVGIFALELKTDVYIYIGLMIVLLSLNLVLFLTYKNVKIEVDAQKISRYGTFGKSTDIWWNEVREIKINQTQNNKILVIRDDEKKIRVNSNFVGYNDLVTYISRNMEPSLIKVTGR